MSLTHVATLVDQIVATAETQYLPAASRAQIVVPATVADGDVLLFAGTSQYEGVTQNGGWTPLIVPTSALYYGPTYKAGTPQAGQRTVTRGYTGLWWRRWAPGADTTIPGSYVPGWPTSVLTIWRGVQGFRDLALLTDFGAAAGVQWPAAAGGAGDVAALIGIWGPVTQGQALASTTPATTVRGSLARQSWAAAALSDVRSAAGLTPGYLADVQGAARRLATVALCEPIAPLAPALGDPAPSAVVDLAAGGTFTWEHKPAGIQGSASGGQEAYALRRRVGVAAYEYWNAGTASWSATIVWNASVDGAVTFPAGAWTNETQYAWSVATKEDAGHNTGPFAPDRTLFARTKPVVAITAPDVIVTTPQPTIAWTVSLTSPWAAIAYEVSVFTTDTADLPGFDPATVAPVWTSGQYASTATAVVPSVPLANGTSYAIFVRVQQTGGQWSDWERADTLVSLVAPVAPHVEAVPSTDPVSGCPVVALTLSARDNLLTAADASVEVPNSWQAGPNTSVDEVPDWSVDGEQSLELTATAAGDVSASIPDPVTVVAGRQYTGQATVHAAATARDVTVAILWEDAGGLSLGSSPSVAVQDATGSAGVLVEVVGVAPDGAAGARLQVTIAGCASSEVHHADRFGISPGAHTAWGPGGFTSTTATVEFSDDPLSGEWGALATTSLDDVATITDWTAQPGQLRAYRATTSAGDYASSPSDVALAGIHVNAYWLVDVDAGAALPVRIRTDENRTHPRDRGEFTAFGRQVSQMRYGDLRTQRGAYSATTNSPADLDTLVALLNSGHTLLVQAPQEPKDGAYPRHLYMAVTSDPETERLVQGPFAYRITSWSWRADVPPVGEGYGGTYPVGYQGAV